MKNARWTQKQIFRIRAEIKSELDAIESASGTKARLEHAIKRIKILQEDSTSFGILRCYTMLCAALVHHIKHGGLSPRVINHYGDFAPRLLLVQGIDPFNSPLSFLYAEVQSMVSQILRQEGDSWGAAWRGVMMSYHGGPSENQSIQLGNRLFRLGYLQDAILHFQDALDGNLSERQTFTAELAVSKILRLQGNVHEALGKIQKLSVSGERKEIIGEAIWEQSCCQSQIDGDLSHLVLALQSPELADQLTYQFEGHLWWLCSSSIKPTKLSVRLNSMRRQWRGELKAHEPMAKAIEFFDHLYDQRVMFHKRLVRLTELERLAQSQISIDKELLVYGAALRWVHRYGSKVAMTPVKQRYVHLCRQLSEGGSQDVLGVLANVVNYLHEP